MAKYISELDVSFDGADEQRLKLDGFMKIDVDLNKGAGGRGTYIWYKNGSVPITRVQVTFNDDMGAGLNRAGYRKINKNLNDGTEGGQIYLWYFQGRGQYHTPIVEIDVTTDAKDEASKIRLDWEKLACNLNRGARGKWIHLWVKREEQTYICDVSATDSYDSDADKCKAGFIRVDEDTNRGSGADPIFIWYRQTIDSKGALNDLKVSTTDDEYQALQPQYQSVSVNLNEGTGGNKVYLWYKTQGSNNPIKAVTLLLNTAAVKEYEKAGATVIQSNLNEGNAGVTEYLSFSQGEPEEA